MKTEAFSKNSFLNIFFIIFGLPVTMCIYINAEYWPEHFFKINFKY